MFIKNNYFQKFVFKLVIFLMILGGGATLLFSPTGSEYKKNEARIFIERGDSASEVGADLSDKNIIRSNLGFKIYLWYKGASNNIQPGSYTLNSSLSLDEIISIITKPNPIEASVKIVEGATVRDIDKVLADSNILLAGEFVKYVKNLDIPVEGLLLPDTYRFYLDSSPGDIVLRMQENFNGKALPLLENNLENYYETIILASIVEREVPNYEDRRIVAGIFKKRLENDWPLQADITLCYEKIGKCYPITQSDKKRDSEYNTYLNKGLPKTAIGNPSVSAIKAVLNSKTTPYWYYISDPLTNKTVFATTLDEHNANISRYLTRN